VEADGVVGAEMVTSRLGWLREGEGEPERRAISNPSWRGGSRALS
jgi:hypothetical protein